MLNEPSLQNAILTLPTRPADEKFNKVWESEFKIDPNIMGGLSIKVGDETLDLSIRGKVKKLINQLNF